jgi:hypothetical protein
LGTLTPGLGAQVGQLLEISLTSHRRPPRAFLFGQGVIWVYLYLEAGEERGAAVGGGQPRIVKGVETVGADATTHLALATR